VRREVFGAKLFERRSKVGVQRRRSKTPERIREYAWSTGEHVVIVQFSPWWGYSPIAAYKRVSGAWERVWNYPDAVRKKVKKWTAAASAPEPDNSPPETSVVLKKYPRTLAFLSDRWYDDKSPRLPGSMWLDSDLGAKKAMLKEPSLKLCARIRAATWDDLFAAVETFLSLDAPPWEPDKYAIEAEEEKKKKKK